MQSTPCNTTLHGVIMFLRLLGRGQFLGLSLLLMTLTALRIPGPRFRSLSLERSLSDVLLLLRPGLWALRERPQSCSVALNTASQGCVLSPGFVTDYVNHDHLATEVFARFFSTAKLLSYCPHFFTVVFGSKSLSTPHF